MDTPNRSTDCARPSSWFDTTIVEISTIALAAARKMVRADRAQDIAQDIALAFVEKFAAGRLTAPPTYLEPVVKRMVIQRVIDRRRRDEVRTKYESDFVAVLEDSHHAWMDADYIIEAEELEKLWTHVLDDLPASCRRAFVLVREDQQTYKLAANHLGVTPLAICQHVVSAQHAFRERLASEGIVSPRPRGAPPPRSTGDDTCT